MGNPVGTGIICPRQGLSVANDLIASMVLAIWLYLIAARGGFWRAAERDDDEPGSVMGRGPP